MADNAETGFEVAIVGGGFSGTMAAIQLLAQTRCQVTLIESGEAVGIGLAYSTTEPVHLLNVAAGSMSAFPDQPAHFANWLERQGLGGPGDYAPRMVYRRYLAELLEPHLDDERLTIVRGLAVSLRDSGGAVMLRLEDGQEIPCDHVILAGGNLPSGQPVLTGPRVIEDPWSRKGQGAVRALARADGDVLVLGTGLTMVDVCLTLAEHGFQGRILASSRRGLVPRAHAAYSPAPLAGRPSPRLAALLRQTRSRAAEFGWRAAIDALRPHSIDLWRGFTLAERRRFLRHLRPYWDVHRHRIAPAVAKGLERLLGTGAVEVLAGRITKVERSEEAVTVTIRRRGKEDVAFREVAAIIDCTGFSGDIRHTVDPLIRNLLEEGMAGPDPLRMGIDVDERSRVLDPGGVIQPGLHAVGPLTRGSFWESVAVPDIRGQVHEVAADIAAMEGFKHLS